MLLNLNSKGCQSQGPNRPQNVFPGNDPKLSSTPPSFFNDLQDTTGMCFYGKEFSPACTEALFGTEFNEDRCKIPGDASKLWFLHYR